MPLNVAMPVNVTFDSNVWRPLVSPATFTGDPATKHFEVIRQAMGKKLLFGFLSETVFTLEAIKKIDRKSFIGGYKADVKTTTEAKDDKKIGTSFSIGPSKTSHANNNPFLERHFNDARPLGFKLLKMPRIAPRSFAISSCEGSACCFVTNDPLEVSPLSRRNDIATPIRPITGRLLLFPISSD